MINASDPVRTYVEVLLVLLDDIVVFDSKCTDIQPGGSSDHV